MSRVLLVGKGPPAQDGIASFLRTLMEGLGHDHDVRLVNLTRDGERAGGRLTLSNLTRTLADAREVWRGARGADVVHVHSALAPQRGLILRVEPLCSPRYEPADSLTDERFP